jgi:transcriptional regulator with XRE-family HTH domain
MTKRVQKELFLDNVEKVHKINMEIGRRIRGRRVEICLTPEEFAIKCHISPVLLSLYENGEIRVSSAKMLLLSNVLNVELSYFFEFV